MGLVWSDEFTGASSNASPSGANWNYDTGGGGWSNNELEVYTSNWDNAHMIWDGTGTDSQALQIKATNGGGTWYSARLKTAGKVSFGPYGYYETRCKFPNAGNGYWPAFWFLGNNIGSVGWPSCGEIDVAEEIDGQWENHQSLHMPGWDPTLVTSPNSSTTTYHNYGANWQPGYVSFYVDGNQTGTFSRGGGGTWEFDGQTMYMLLNCAVGGNWPGNPDGGTQGTGYFDVDYVRQYEYIGDTLYQNVTLTSGGELISGSHTCRMQSDGNLVVYNGNSPLWASGTSGIPERTARCSPTGTSSSTTQATERFGLRIHLVMQGRTARCSPMETSSFTTQATERCGRAALPDDSLSQRLNPVGKEDPQNFAGLLE